MASGKKVFKAKRLFLGIETVNKPTPDLKQAFAAIKTAPILDVFPAINKA